MYIFRNSWVTYILYRRRTRANHYISEGLSGFLRKMKFIFALTTLAFACTDDNQIAYLCNQCDLYDTSSNTVFDNLEIPYGPRPPPSPDSTMSINIKHND